MFIKAELSTATGLFNLVDRLYQEQRGLYGKTLYQLEAKS